MPALLVDTSTPSTSPSTSSTPSDPRPQRRSQSRSPDRPPVSPISPTLSAAQLAPPPQPHPPADTRTRVAAPQPPPVATFTQQPPSVPISESDNTDAIALRSAISLLQLQREKSKRDLKALQDLKAAAIADPHGFMRSVQEQSAQAAKRPADILSPTLSDLVESAVSESVQGHEGENGAARKDSAAAEHSTKFPTIPQPQNVVRCPPVNWAKYHIVGEPLDKLHEEQKRYPGSTEPPRTQQGTKAPPHQIAAPYSPFTDGIGGPPPTGQPYRGSKKTPPKKSPS